MIVVFGSINVDLVFSLPHLPAAGETVLGQSYSVVPGGKGANQAVAAARDGGRVAMYGAVGADGFAAVARGSLAAAKVDLTGVMQVAEPTGCASICVDRAGRNQIAVASGANLAVRAAQTEMTGESFEPLNENPEKPANDRQGDLFEQDGF